ncbi:MAG: homoserine O-succinyltransferase [Oscillospiraceae bacterium]|jgi:homoserine O-succinyltransferase|nr:homoserine O-succinyltransferase [Oscillospiraceae bacterium]
MPIKIDASLPARGVLEMENIFVMSRERAMHQDIRPLKIVILNLMPTKVETETQLLRLLSNSPIQIEVDLLQTATHISKNTSQQHMLEFYQTFEDVRDKRYDGMIVTGAPVEQLPFEQVDYWDELRAIFDWSRRHVYSTFHICWGAQAAMYYYYGVPKYPLEKKLSGVYAHRMLDPLHPLLRGLDDEYLAPHSRYTEVRREDIAQVRDLQILAYSDRAGVALVSDMQCRNVFSTGHSEYDRETLAKEYFRDVGKGLDVAVPFHYFPDDDPRRTPKLRWRSAASLLFTNWINYFVYQKTPYDLSQL